MTAPPALVAVLLVELARRGIEIRVAGDRLRCPRSAMTPDLAVRLTAHRADLLATLAAATAAVDAAKVALSPLGGGTIRAVWPWKSAARDDAARLIRDARRGGDDGRAVAPRDARPERWRSARWTTTSAAVAERVAADDLTCNDMHDAYNINMSSREVIRRLEADGWRQVRMKGSHRQFEHPDKPGLVTVPHPKRELPAGTLRAIFKQAGWSD